VVEVEVEVVVEVTLALGEAAVNSEGSVDMEEMLKQEIKAEIKDKITGIDNKLKVYFDEHNG
jgi:hypothetical protein